MQLLTLNNFNELAGHKSDTCISIYFSTHTAGREVFNGIDQIALKNKLKEAHNALVGKHSFSADKATKMLKPAHALLEDEQLWRYMSQGIALFISENHFSHYRLPVGFSERLEVGKSFYLVPLVAALDNNERFYLLALSMNKVRLFEGSKSSMREIEIDHLLPDELEDAAGHDYKEKSLQHHSGDGAGETAIFHGHGASNDEVDKIEAQKFFRDIDHGLDEILRNQTAPLMLAAVDYLVPLYKERNSYNHLMEQHISGNPDKLSAKELHDKAIGIMSEKAISAQHKIIEDFGNQLAGGQATTTLLETVPKAVNGRVNLLFVQSDAPAIPGQFIEQTNTAITTATPETSTDDLINLAVVQTIQQGGKVLVLPEEEMPTSNTPIAAMLRY
jgi:hypothetical protein